MNVTVTITDRRIIISKERAYEESNSKFCSYEGEDYPKGSMYDGRAALEMILAIYESHRLNAAVELPLENRKHPLSMMSDRG